MVHGKEKLIHELKALTMAMMYFGSWLAVLLLLKKLILAEYQIQFSGLSIALVGTLVLSKVVLILEHVPLGRWLHSRPAWVVVLFRTFVYSLGVFAVLVLERAFEKRHEYGGLGASLNALYDNLSAPHVWSTTICLAGALLGYNTLTVIRRHLGEGGLRRIFTEPLGEDARKLHAEPHRKTL